VSDHFDTCASNLPLSVILVAESGCNVVGNMSTHDYANSTRIAQPTKLAQHERSSSLCFKRGFDIYVPCDIKQSSYHSKRSLNTSSQESRCSPCCSTGTARGTGNQIQTQEENIIFRRLHKEKLRDVLKLAIDGLSELCLPYSTASTPNERTNTHITKLSGKRVGVKVMSNYARPTDDQEKNLHSDPKDENRVVVPLQDRPCRQPRRRPSLALVGNNSEKKISSESLLQSPQRHSSMLLFDSFSTLSTHLSDCPILENPNKSLDEVFASRELECDTCTARSIIDRPWKSPRRNQADVALQPPTRKNSNEAK
jgi:hypothetical protein